MNEWEWQLLEEKTPLTAVRVSGMDLKLGDDIYESFRAYQRALLKEYSSMADEFSFRVLDARRKVDVIQDELRRQIAAFLAEAAAPAAARPDQEISR